MMDKPKYRYNNKTDKADLVLNKEDLISLERNLQNNRDVEIDDKITFSHNRDIYTVTKKHSKEAPRQYQWLKQ